MPSTDLPSPLHILYEDESIVAVDKPAGQLAHPADVPTSGDEVTLKILRDQIGQQLHLIHRLDRPTCGVLLFAKGRTAARALSRAFERRQITKTYLTIVNGHPSEDSWVCDETLQKDEKSKALEASTSFQTLARLPGEISLVEARPHTGRYHQIRRHLLHCGHPIVGDYRYIPFEHCEEQRQSFDIGTRMLLQAKSLQFPHPITKESLIITAPTDALIARLAGEDSGNPATALA